MSEATNDLKLVPSLTTFEAAFIRAALENRGVFVEPTDALKRYDQQCLENLGGSAWEPTLRDEESQAELRAKVFLMFVATKPTPAQWQ